MNDTNRKINWNEYIDIHSKNENFYQKQKEKKKKNYLKYLPFFQISKQRR